MPARFFFRQWLFGAEQLVIVSASSKTAIGLAYALADDNNARAVIGLTSTGNVGMVETLGLYELVLPYGALSSVDATRPTAIVDMSCSGGVLSDLHLHLGNNIRYCSNVGVGVTHWSDNATGPEFIRERSAMFFAPGHIKKRAAEWGPGEFENRAHVFWRRAAERSRLWLTFRSIFCLKRTGDIFEELRTGGVSPNTGIVVDLPCSCMASV